MKVMICPLRSLAAKAETAGNCAALLSSSADLAHIRLPDIFYVFRQYEDLDVETPGRSFSAEDAEMFAAFVRSLPENVDTVFCCCDAGQSRSPAVAAAVCRFFGMEDIDIWRDPSVHPNMLVFDLLTQALGVPVSDEEKDLRLYENQRAFRNAIRAARK